MQGQVKACCSSQYLVGLAAKLKVHPIGKKKLDPEPSSISLEESIRLYESLLYIAQIGKSCTMKRALDVILQPCLLKEMAKMQRPM